jgi:hypothetical protein
MAGAEKSTAQKHKRCGAKPTPPTDDEPDD